MGEDIRVEQKNVVLSDTVLDKIQWFIKNENRFHKHYQDCLKDHSMSVSSFEEMLDFIFQKVHRIMNNIPNEEKFDVERVHTFKSFCEEYKHISSSDGENFDGVTYFHEKRFDQLKKLIDLSYKIIHMYKEIYLLRDLSNAFQDCLDNLKYFESDSTILAFREKYSKALQEKNIDIMNRMLLDVQQKIVEEWKKYTDDIDHMNEEKFRFIGHSVYQSFNKPFHTRYVSCSLFTESLTDTYNRGVGFIMSPTDIVGAKSSDMHIQNNAEDTASLLFYSEISIINHPQRIIDENMKFLEQEERENQTQSDTKIYNEIIKDGFHPIGIFCFTDGSKNLNQNYIIAQALQKQYPTLKIKEFDIMKIKTGKRLEKLKLQLLRKLQQEVSTSFTINYESLPKYDIFFEKYNELKRNGQYTEEDIKQIFQYNLNLLSFFGTEPRELFSGRYSEKEIRYILGKNVRYNIDSFLNGEIYFASISNLLELSAYLNQLDTYYEGLEAFIRLLLLVDVTEAMIEEMRRLNPIHFYSLSKYLAKHVLSSLNADENEVSNRLEKNREERKNRIFAMQEKQVNMEEKYVYYQKIQRNQYMFLTAQKDYQDLIKDIGKNHFQKETLLFQESMLRVLLEKLKQQKEVFKARYYEKTEEFKNFDAAIRELELEIKDLEKHPVLNALKKRNSEKKLVSLKNQEQVAKRQFDSENQSALSGIESQMNEAYQKLETIGFLFRENHQQENLFQQQLKHFQEKVYDWFGCSTIFEVPLKIEEAEKYLEDYSQTFYNIKREIECLEKTIASDEGLLSHISEQQEAMAKVV